MPVVAIAGGTGSVGRFIVEEIVADGNFEVIILGRKANLSLEKKLGARILPIDYSDPDGIASLLEDNHVDVVVAALSGHAPPEQEIGLIQAAAKSKTTRRYIPSVWGVKYRPEHSWFFNAAAKLSLFDALEKTDLEWTAVSNGFFLDYWGGTNLKTYLDPLTIVLDIPARKAAIPGNPNQPPLFTYTRDVARFVAAALDLATGEQTSWIVGDRITWNELAKQVQQVKGVPFHVTHDSVETLKKGVITELPSHPELYEFYPEEHLQGFIAAFGVMCERGQANFTPNRTLNDAFPDIKPLTAREVLEKGWAPEKQ